MVRIQNDEPALIDSLGRASYVRGLSQVLQSCETPLVVGLYGSWGAGKTSLLKQLQASLLSCDQYCAVWYDPWQHQFDEHPAVSLLQATYDQLELGKSSNRKLIKALVMGISYALAKSAISHVPVIGNDVAAITEQAGKIAEVVRSQELEQAFQRREFQQHLHESFTEFVSAALEPYTKAGVDPRLFFFIDDLDRCTPDRVVSLLESLKLFLNVPRCVFVLGLDREPIEAAIQQQYSWAKSSQAEYLDKIVQLELVIPSVALTTREVFVRNSLASIFGDTATSSDAPLIRNVVRLLAVGVGGNPRKLKRAVGSFSLMHLLGSEIVANYRAERLALALLIQQKSPGLFRALTIQPERVTELQARTHSDDGNSATFGELYMQFVAKDYEFSQAIQFAAPFIDGDLLPYLQLAEPSRELGPEYYLPEILNLHRRYMKGSEGGQRAILDGTTLNGVTLQGCNLSSASFVSANFEDSDFSGSDFSKANLSKSSALRANFSHTRFDQAVATGLRVRESLFRNCEFFEVDFTDSELLKATFTGAKIKSCKLVGCRLDRSDFSRTTIEDVDWSTLSSVVGVDFTGACIVGCTFSGARIEASSFHSVGEWKACKLVNSDFSGCNLGEVKFRDVDLSDSRFVGAQMLDADLRGSTLRGADLRSVHLDRSQFHNADLSETILDDAVMVDVQAHNANFVGASLRRADLLGADLHDADFSGAVMSDAILDNDVWKWIRWDEQTVWPDGGNRSSAQH